MKNSRTATPDIVASLDVFIHMGNCNIVAIIGGTTERTKAIDVKIMYLALLLTAYTSFPASSSALSIALFKVEMCSTTFVFIIVGTVAEF